MDRRDVLITLFASSALPALFATFVATASGQVLIREHLGPASGGSLGDPVVVLADLDGDGVREYALNDTTAGTIDVRSGATGALLFTVPGTGNTGFGDPVGVASDMDGDGLPDLLVGEPWFDDPNQPYAHEGAVRIHSGKDGALIREFFGAADDNQLGASVDGLDDVDGDGTPDILVIANDVAKIRIGHAASAISGSDGHVIYTVAMDDVGAIRVGVDRDGDGVRDFVVGANYCRGCMDAGYYPLRAVSGATGATIFELIVDGTVDTLAEVDDLDGDGQPEVLAGGLQPSGWWEYPPFPGVEVYSIASGAWVRGHPGWFGDRLADVDGDGIDDYLVSARFSGQPAVVVVSGRSGKTLYSFADDVAGPVQSLGDVDGDRLPDFVVGAPGFVDSNGMQRGRARIYSGNDFWLNAGRKAVNPNDWETLTARGVPEGNLIGVAVIDVSGTPLFQFLAFGSADSTEALILGDNVPPGLSGLTATFQAFAIGRSGRVIDSADETIAFL